MKQFKRVIPPLLAGLLTLLLFTVGYAVFKLYPLGGKTIAWCDMNQQAVPLLLQMKEILRSGESLTYTTLSAGGMNFWGVFFFFLSNPLSFVVLLTDLRADFLMNLLVPLKLALCAGTAAVWLRYRSPKLPSVFQVLLALMYGCSGYGLFYYQNLMWLDVQAMLPLMLIAVDKLLHGKRNLPYILALSVIIILNFYTGYMVVLFLLLYIALRIWFYVPKAERGETALRFWICNLLAAMLTAFVWFPTLLQVTASARSSNLIASVQSGVVVDALPDKISLLGCTALAFAAYFLLWQYRDENEKSHLRRRVIAILFLPAMLIDPINRMWHMGSYQAFPFRWCFIPLLLLLTFSTFLLTFDISEHQHKKTAAVLPTLLLIVYAAVAMILYRTKKKELTSYVTSLWVSEIGCLWMFLPTLLAAVIYGLCILRFRKGKLSLRSCAVILCAMFCGEFALNFTCYMGAAGNIDSSYPTAMAAAHQIDDSDGFYRVRLAKKYTHANMVGALGYPSLSHYTSLTREDYLEGMKKFGYTSYWMEVSATGGTVLSDAVWNVRYLLGQNWDFSPEMNRVWTNGVLTYAKNDIQLPLGVVTQQNPAEIADLPSGSRSGIQNTIAERMLGVSDLVTDYEITETEKLSIEKDTDTGMIHCQLDDEETVGALTYTFHVEDEQALYFDLFSLTGTQIYNPRKNAATIYFNGSRIESEYPDNALNGMVYLGTVSDKDVKVRVLIEKSFDCESLGVCGFHMETLRSACENAVGATVNYDGKGRYTAHSEAAEPSLLVLAIPYDEGFSAKVNGQSAEVFRVNTCMTAVQVPAGAADVSLDFVPRGLRCGELLSVLGILLTTLWLSVRRAVDAKHKLKFLRQAALWAVSGAFVLVILLVYIAPCVIFIIGLF